MTSGSKNDRYRLARGTSAVVIAGAGTGKTTRLIGEIVALIALKDVPIERILAVTFSDAAAADMREKLRVRLESQYTETNDRRYFAALSGLERAQISTIHSFSLRVLRENPFEAGIDPEFIIEEEAADILTADELWGRWAKSVFWGGGDLDEELVALLKRMSVESLKDIGYVLAARPDRMADYSPHRIDALAERRVFEKRLDDLRRSVSTITPQVAEKDPLYDRFLAVREILKTDDLIEVERLVASAGLKKQGGGRNRWSHEEEFQHVKELIDGPGGAVDTLKEVGPFLRRLEQDSVVGTAIKVLSRFVDFALDHKRRRGLLSFFDLIHETRNLLVKNRAVRKRYQDAFDYVLVDEFQDTDPILGDIVLLLAEDGPKAGRPEEVRLKPGKLFIVGDPKQSIYRFREAEVGVFFSVREKIEASGGVVEDLVTSYRSQRHLISFQNAFFDRYVRYQDARYTIDYVSLETSVPDIATAARAPAVRIVNSDPEAAMSAEETRRAEADLIAMRILELVEQQAEGRIVRDKGTGTGRGVDYRDIAILFRSMSRVSGIYEEALRREGIPFFIVGGKGYFQRQEVYDLISILRATFDPTDRRSLIGALRSPVFGIDDRTLFSLSRNRRLSYLEDGAGESAEGAFTVLKKLHASAFRLTLTELLSEIYAVTPIMEVNAFGPGGEQRVGNLVKIKETAALLESKGPVTLSAFLTILTKLSLTREDEGEAVVTEEGRNAVRIMTVHRAKGLEFPIVFVPDLGREITYRPKKGIFLDRSEKDVSGAQLGPVADLGYNLFIKQSEERRAAAEEKRLLYVAATRARDRLFLVGSPKEKTSHMRALVDFIETGSDPAQPAIMEELDLAVIGKYFVGKKKGRLDDLLAGGEDTTPLEEARRREEERGIECGRSLGRRSFAFVTEGKEEEPLEPIEAAIASTPDGDRIGRLVGILVHEVLATIDLSGDGRADTIVEAAAVSLGLPDDIRDRVIDEAKTLALRFLASDVRRHIADSRIVGREVPIITSRDGVTITGRIDIVYETEDGLVVLDYKTDTVTKEGAPRAAERYRGQIAAYVDALTDATKTDKSIQGGVYFVRADAVVYFE